MSCCLSSSPIVGCDRKINRVHNSLFRLQNYIRSFANGLHFILADRRLTKRPFSQLMYGWSFENVHCVMVVICIRCVIVVSVRSLAFCDIIAICRKIINFHQFIQFFRLILCLIESDRRNAHHQLIYCRSIRPICMTKKNTLDATELKTENCSGDDDNYNSTDLFPKWPNDSTIN